MEIKAADGFAGRALELKPFWKIPDLPVFQTQKMSVLQVLQLEHTRAQSSDSSASFLDINLMNTKCF